MSSYRSTIDRQPEALANTRDAIAIQLETMDLSRLDCGVIGVTGIGASLAAARLGAAELRRLGRRSTACYPGEIGEEVDRDRRPVDAIVGLSHRGRSVETVKAFVDNPDLARLAITRDPDSPLASAGDLHLRLDNGEDATPSATGYTATLLGLAMACERMTSTVSTDWDALPGIVRAVLDDAASSMPRLARQFTGRRAIDCVAAASSTGTADEAALLLREAARVPSSGFETRDYLHGPMEAMDGMTGVVVFGYGREVELARNLDAIGCPTLLVTSLPQVEEGRHLTVVRVPSFANVMIQGLIDILVPQLLAATLSDAAGLTDVPFRYRQGDTKIA